MRGEEVKTPLTLDSAYRLLALEPETLLKDCRQERFQASGPGGQKRNRVYSAIRLVHASTGIRAASSEAREAARNLGVALQKLRIEIALGAELPTPGDSEDASSSQEDGAGSLILSGDPRPAFRSKVSPSHVDFPRFVLQALHYLALAGGDPAPGARQLGVTPSAFIRFFKSDKRLWQKVQQIRREQGLPPFH